MDDAIDQRCVLLQGFPLTPNPHEDILRLLNHHAGIQTRKLCQLHSLSATNSPDWVILCHSQKDAVAILDKAFLLYQGCQLTVSPCGARDVPPEWRNPRPEPQGTMHSLGANNGSSSPTENEQLHQHIPEEPSDFQSMNYNVENPQICPRAGMSGGFMSLNRNYSSTAGIQHTSHGFPPRHPNDVPYYQPVYHPGIPGPAHPQRPVYSVDPNEAHHWQPHYPYPRFPVPTYPWRPPLLDSYYPNPNPNFGYGPPPPPIRMPVSSLSVDHPVSSVTSPPENNPHQIVPNLKYPDEMNSRKAIEVHGCDFGSGSLDKYKFFFENERRGGGDVEDFQHDEENNMLVITFTDPAVAHRLVEMGKVTIANEEAEIKRHTPLPVYVDKALLKYPGVHHDEGSVELFIYLEARATVDVKTIRKGAKDDVLLVTFNGPVDIPKLQSACNLRPFQTKGVTVSEVPATKVLTVERVPVSITPETVSDYFETRKCGNDMQTEVVKVEELGQDGCYLVHFADHKVVEQISSREHKLGEESIKVHLHHKCIGPQSSEFTDATRSQMSGAVLVEGVHQLVPRFLRKSRKVLRNIQEKLSGYGLSLELNESNQVFVVQKVGRERESKAACGIDVQGLARSAMNEFVLQLSVPIPTELQDSVDAMVKQITVDETEAKMFTDMQVLAIVGIPSKATEIKEDVERHIADKMSSKGLNKIVNEQVKSLTPLKVKFLRECGINGGMKQFSGVSVRFDGKVINLSGPEASVKEAMIQLYQRLNGTQTSVIEDISIQQLTVLQKKAVEDKVREELKRAGIEASWHTKESSLEVISTSEENVGKFIQMLRGIVVERIVPFEGRMQLVMQSESWESFQKSLVDYLPDTFSIHNVQDKSYLLIAGLKDDVESVYAEVTDFLSSNTVKETCLKFPRGVYRFLLVHYKDKVAKIAKDLKDCHVQIVYPEKGAEFTINGSREGIDQCREQLTSLADKILTHRELFRKAGMARMLKTDKGGRIVSHVEKVERCMIEIINGEEKEKEEETGHKAAASPEPVSAIVAVSNIAGGRKLYVREGDITTVKVSAIVNAANGRLDHCGGLAKYIVDKGGREIQEECDRHVNSHGQVLDGGAALSGPGNLKGSCDFIVHAVGPRWKGGKKKEREHLREAVTRSLELTDGRGGSSIAIPALSAGIFEYPLDAATKVITTAVRDYFRECKSSSIKDVYFCTDTRKNVDSFVKSLQNVLGETNVLLQPRSQGGTGAEIQRSSCKVPRVSAQTRMESGCQVKLVEGDIAQQKVDVIVTTRSKEMDFRNEGPVARRLIEVGGPGLQAACHVMKSKNPGPIVVTPGFKLTCKKVYHVYLKPFSPPTLPLFRQSAQIAKDVTDIVKECLETAGRHNCSSIAMPALGSGNAGYPPDLVAEAMLTAIQDFWAQNPGTSLTDIRVILYPKNKRIIQVFKDKAQKMETDGPRTSQSRRRVILTRGSITRFKADVIVHPTDNKLSLTRGRLSKAISDAAGQDLEAQCRRIYQTGFHGLAVTSAGRLQASEIYHVVVSPWDGVQGTENLHRAVTLCLEEASRNKHTSLLFPTLGVGLSGYDKHASARIMFRATDAFWRTHPDTTLTDVKIVIYDKDNDVAKAFEKESRLFYGQPTSIRRGRQLTTDIACTDDPYDVSGGITFGNIHFTLKHGDLLQEKVDCIINSVDSQFNLQKGTINQALLRAFPGVGKDNRTQKEKDVRSKGLTVSQVAGATFNTVVHFEEFHFDHDVKKILKTCIKQADKLHCSSVALPALGQGPRGGVPEHLLMDYLYDALQDISNLKYVTEVRLVLYEADRYGRFNDLLTSLLNRRGIAKKPLFGDKNKGHGGARPKTQPRYPQTEPRLYHVQEHIHPDGVTVTFFSDSLECIHSAKEKLENACKKEFDDQIVENDTVSALGEEKICRLQGTAKLHGVSIDINTRIGRIRLQGLKDDVAAMCKSVYEICLEQKDDEHAEAVGACVQWYYMDTLDNGDEELVEYDQNTNKLIEKRFRGGEETYELEDMEGKKYIVDFKDMVEYRDDDLSTKVTVIRKDLIQALEFDPPHNWEPMGGNENLKVCRIGHDSAEYRHVAGSFSSSKRTIIKIERVQNKSLYKQYMAKKEEFNKRRSGTIQERQLWHGTATEAIPSINSYGFNRSYCGKNAVAYGNGVYFAVDVNYSTQDKYSRPDPAGNKYIYLVDVLTGRYTSGKSGMRVPPPIDPANLAVLYDSVVENIQQPGMFVIFNDTQAYPKYLITYK